MKKRLLFFLFLPVLLSCMAKAEISSLSEIFLLGKGIKDTDGDGFGDKVSLQIIIPDNPGPYELALAADMAARANLESLAVDFFIVKRESELPRGERPANPVFIGSRISLLGKMARDAGISLPRLKSHQGLVFIISSGKDKAVAVVAGSDETLLRTGRAFFLRWPYFWEIWGREEGATYLSFEEDLAAFFSKEKVEPLRTTVLSAFYEFPQEKPAAGTLGRLKFNRGEIAELKVEVEFSGKEDKEKALRAITSLAEDRQRGLRTDVLSYPGCAGIGFILRSQGLTSRVSLPRSGYPGRMLTPAFKEQPRRNIPEKNFDLLNLFTTRGFYSDGDKDGIPDTLDSTVVISREQTMRGIIPLATRLVLPTAGASFPIVHFDDEIEDAKSLVAPVLIGLSGPVRELIKKGKWKPPLLENGRGMAAVITQAFNKSNAFLLTGGDGGGLEKILDYFGRTFPYLEDYKEGTPGIHDVASDVEKFLKGEKGSGEAFLFQELKKAASDLGGRELEIFEAGFFLPRENPEFKKHAREFLGKTLDPGELSVRTEVIGASKIIFEKEKEFPWEADQALDLIREKLEEARGIETPVKISLGVSESPETRRELKNRIEKFLEEQGIPRFEVEVLSAYKQGFFWILEKVVPALKGKNPSRLVIAFSPEDDDLDRPKRFYTEPLRWLQELYPVDELIARELSLPPDKSDFEMKRKMETVYEVLAYDGKERLLLREGFSPRVKEQPFLRLLPEWGSVRINTGWVRIDMGNEVLADLSLETDLERFWNYYQEEVLPPVHSFIMKKTENDPSFSKQPYFKRLRIEAWFSEPDFKLGLDEEIVSSLESIHDEIYFDTLDFLRGITGFDPDDKDLPEDTSRFSAPGNVLPVIHPSREGQGGKTRVVFEDWQARSPELHLRWKEKGRDEATKKIVFPSLDAKTMRAASLVYDGREETVENLLFELEFEKESQHLALIDIVHSCRLLQEKGLVSDPFRFPRLKTVTLKTKHKDLEKEETLSVLPGMLADQKPATDSPGTETLVTTTEIISPEMCLEITGRLGRFETVRSYIAGRSYENRKIPVLEVFTPAAKHVSIPRLVTFKPTLYASGRQHANEVSATNYILKFAELLAKDPDFREYLNKMNIVLHPMENPDGATLAYELQKLTPFHCLHAGRYSPLGIEIGHLVNVPNPLLPEALVRKNLNDKWLPDVYLNLHGYPSHEWVQQFSGYSPYLFRDYWIPRGWFAYFRGLSLPIYQRWKEAAEELKEFIIKEMLADEAIRASNEKFYDRYFRWAARWQPHLSYLELHDGLNLYARRRSDRESRLTPRSQTTFIEQTPELMDETARGDWLDFLCRKGITYLRAHALYFSRVRFETARIEEEIRDRIHIQFVRSRPGSVKPSPKN